MLFLIFPLWLLLAACQLAVFASLIKYPSVSLSLEPLFDNQAASTNGSADFDGTGASFDSQFLPTGPWVFDGISYDVPIEWGISNDNVIANSQNLSLANATFVHELHFLYAGDASETASVKNFVLHFDDNSTQTIQLVTNNWWAWPLLNWGTIRTPYHFEKNGGSKNLNSTQIFQWSTSVSSERSLKSITFPANTAGRRLHVFAMAISPSVRPSPTTSRPVLSIRRTRFTSRWEMVNGKRAQAVEVTIANILPNSAQSRTTSITTEHSIIITGSGITTVRSGSVYRLVPGDQARVDVFVIGSQTDGKASVQVKDSNGAIVGTSEGWATTPLIEKWTEDVNVLSQHETPAWFNKAKFGIFIHWGVYSFPAWAPPGTYAEWYDWSLHNPANSSSPTWNHHLQTFGKNVVYDDFIANFTTSKFNASAWVDLFDRAGAKYFVLVTKHHDGFALFNTGSSTHRSSVHTGPHRDLVDELLSTAKKEKPGMHRGTYYSLPEWFNPDYAKYGFGSWPGGLAHNAFNGSQLEPYTGRLNISDYLEDLQLPHMLDLATKYDTEIMWCDIGGPNKTLEFAAQFYNHAQAQGRQVTMNNRCGDVPDFDTPEYATFGAIQTRKWESNEGMDPFSYGLNTATTAEQYKNATSIIHSLVDIVSKNGNYLLDIGPTAEGEIIAPMMNNLLDAGVWLGYSGSCVYDTDYWFPGSQDESGNIRFTTTPKTFCIVSLAAPIRGQLIINKRLPLLPGDDIVLLQPGTSTPNKLEWDVGANGQVIIQLEQSEINNVNIAWAFEVVFN
ncbi:glycoside hydrolase family 29 protein [Crucibulum laeve]|uniref:alpha-L-fucosidase n=1 Tax=Crucibulum laeve TaxID=68775 RepID=A0A5C3LMK5_9AGAR|nr:glycoside hydrolase family 29 protein [Crucibulum laeve]